MISVIKRNKCTNSIKRFVFNNIFNPDEMSYCRLVKGLSSSKSLTDKFLSYILPHKDELLNYDVVLRDDVNEKGLISFVSYIINNRKNLINEFVRLKKKYENYLYREDYISAKETLNTIDENICFSMWSCSQRFILEEQMGGLESNKQLLYDYLNVSKNKTVISAILDFMSTLAEKNTSYYTFQDKISKLLSTLEKRKKLHNYFSYKFDLEYAFSYGDLSSVMQMEFQFSIIDVYEAYVSFAIFDSINDKRFIDIIAESVSAINDNRLQNTMILSNYNQELIDVHNKDYYCIYDLYTKGDYVSTIELINNYHDKHYYDFQLVILFVKSHIYLNMKVESNSLLIKSIYNVYSLNEQCDESINTLNMYIKEFAFVDWGKKIKALIKRKTSFENDNNLIAASYLYDTIASPNFVRILPDKYVMTFINDIKKVCPNSARLFECYLKNEEIIGNEIDEKRRLIYNVLIKNKKGDLNTATVLLETQIDKMLDEDAYYSEKIVRLLFVNYLSNNSVSKYVALCVKAYMKNKNYIKRLPIAYALKILDESQKRDIFRLIEYPIFIDIAKKNDNNEIKMAYENFLEENNIYDVLDITKDKRFSEEYVRYFLTNICTLDVLKKDVNIFRSGISYTEIRIRILRNLIENDNNRRKIYENEIAEIMKKIEIDNRAEQINKSRIYVDVDKIYTEIKQWLSEYYDMYINVKNFATAVDGIDVNSDSFIEDLSRVANELNERMKKEPLLSQEYILVNNMISRITEEFLFNPIFGLESFLSSRIRHGYLKDQLITVFVEHGLISKTINDDSGKYLINEFLSSTTKTDDELECFLPAFSDFTNKIEKKINEINTNWIRIKYHRGEVGLFDFSNFVRNTQLISLDNITDYRMFYNSVVEVLWEYVKKSLEIIKSLIEGSLKKYFEEALFTLEKEIEMLEKEYPETVSQIKQKINLCKSVLPDTINKFKEVFQVQGNKCKDFTLNDLVSTCKQINKSLFAKYDEITFEDMIDFKDCLDGMYFPYLVDIICILINNAINHSGYDGEKLKIEIKMFKLPENIKKEIIDGCKAKYSEAEKIEDDLLCISVKNNLNNVDIDEKQKDVESIFNNLYNPEVIKKYAQKEGGSGVYKIYQRLKYNMHSPYIITFDIKEGEFEFNIFLGLSKLLSRKERV